MQLNLDPLYRSVPHRGPAWDRILVFPDIHQALPSVLRTLKKYESTVDGVLFLGDYFDARRGDESVSATTLQTVQWLKKSLHDPKHAHLWGNHDTQYLCDWDQRCPGLEMYYCGGASRAQWSVIYNNLTDTDRRLGKFIWQWGPFTFSHAGIDARLQPSPLGPHAAATELECMDNILQGKTHAWVQAGYSRQGFVPVPGVTWCDWNYDFLPIVGVHQIMSHTARRPWVRMVAQPFKTKPTTVEWSPDLEWHIEALGRCASVNFCVDTMSLNTIRLDRTQRTFEILISE